VKPVVEAVLIRVEHGDVISDRPRRTVRALLEHPSLDVTWSRYEPGERGPDPHIHHRHVDAFYVVEGELHFGVGEKLEAVTAPAGTFVLVPREIVHTFANASEATARWLNFHAPSTGFIAALKGGPPFDSEEAPREGGGSRDDAVVASGEGILGSSTDLHLAVLDIPPGVESRPHRNPDTVDGYLVLDGTLELAHGGRRENAGPGSWLSAPPGSEHGFRNGGEATARLLHVRAPAS
jgi:quercetin dioxygenase-like cupin family protein